MDAQGRLLEFAKALDAEAPLTAKQRESLRSKTPSPQAQEQMRKRIQAAQRIKYGHVDRKHTEYDQ